MDIAGTVNHANDDDLSLREAVVQRIIAVKMRPQPLGQIIPSGANLRLQQEGGKTLFDLPDKLRGGGWVILGDEAPDIDYVLLCAFGYAEGSGFCNCCSPFRMMRSGSKSRTRPASMSSRPCRTLARSS